MKRVRFFYDYSCPYAYLGHSAVEPVCERAGAELEWRPFLLGGVFRSLGAAEGPMATLGPAKARHNWLDMRRVAEHDGVPFEQPPTHPNRTVLALRATLASGDMPGASRALFAAYWGRGLDVSDPAVVRAALDGAGLDGASAVERADDPAVKQELRERTDEAIALGIFGAPAFLVTAPGRDEELFWGRDRLVLVERALAGELRPASAPAWAPSGAVR